MNVTGSINLTSWARFENIGKVLSAVISDHILPSIQSGAGFGRLMLDIAFPRGWDHGRYEKMNEEIEWEEGTKEEEETEGEDGTKGDFFSQILRLINRHQF